MVSKAISQADKRDRIEDEYIRNKRLKSENERDTVVQPLLPTKNNGAVIDLNLERKIKHIDSKEDEYIQSNSDTSELDIESLEMQATKEESVIEKIVKRNQLIKHNYEIIETIKRTVVSEPEKNLESIEYLFNLTNKKQIPSLKKLAVVALTEIFIELTPDYYIRDLTEIEKSSKVSKETKKIREFEDAFLRKYKRHLDLLYESLKEQKKLFKRSKNQESFKIQQSFLMEIIESLIKLMNKNNHFNYFDDIVRIMVSFTNAADCFNEISTKIIGGISLFFQNDTACDASLKIVQRLARFIKEKALKIKPQVIDCFLSLNINENIVNQQRNEPSKKEKQQEKLDKFDKMSKKEKKYHKETTKIQKELEKAELTNNTQKNSKNQLIMIDSIFGVYFRLIKTENVPSKICSACLRGIGKFSHMIGVEFYYDLLNCLMKVCLSDTSSFEDQINSILASLKIYQTPRGSDIVLIDPYKIYNNAFRIISIFCLNPLELNKISIRKPFVECLIIILNDRRRQIGPNLSCAFVKRLLLLLCHLDDVYVVANIISLINGLKNEYGMVKDLFDEDLSQGIINNLGVFDFNPTFSLVNNDSSWHISILKRHYSHNFNNAADFITSAKKDQVKFLLEFNSFNYLIKNNPKTMNHSFNQQFINDFQLDVFIKKMNVKSKK